MSLLIKPTPVLTGEDAQRFAKAIENPKPVLKEEYLRAKKTYEAVVRKHSQFSIENDLTTLQ